MITHEDFFSLQFLVVQVVEDLTYSPNATEVTKKGHQSLYFVRLIWKNHISQEILVAFYRSYNKSMLTYCMCVWYRSWTTA